MHGSFACRIRTGFEAFIDSETGVFGMFFTFFNLHSRRRFNALALFFSV
jgi:hypothetical protein